MVTGLNAPRKKDSKVRDLLGVALQDRKGVPQEMFGPIQLRADNSGWARWERTARQAKFFLGTDLNRQFRYGPWAIHLNGGPQAAGEDWASIQIPVDNMPMEDLWKIQWNYYKFLAGTADVGGVSMNLVISTMDPDNPESRADISQQAGHGAPITAGWHTDTLLPGTTKYMFWYGDNVGSPLMQGTLYTLEAFKTDPVFKNHVIYRIGIDYGYWGATRSTGDVWVGLIQINDKNIPMIPTDLNDLGTRPSLKGESFFGEPVLRTANNGKAGWVKDTGNTEGLNQKSTSGYLANLYGGVQTNDDWAAVYIPVNEMPVPLFDTARWSYRQTNAEVYGVNMVIWVHDPFDHDIRAEITQAPSGVTLAKGAGWNNHNLNPDTTQFFYFGEGITNTSITPTAGTQYKWSQFQGDERFNTMTIYRISFEWGWYSTGTFEDAWV
ncbi:hypothetical protein LCGC14_2547440, partial [marine sediment metagenome]